MPTFYWTRGRGLVSSQPTDQNAAQVQSARGSADIRLIIQDVDANGATPVLLDADQIVGVVYRDPANFSAGYAAGPVVLTRGATPADGYIGTASTDTTYVRKVMHVGDDARDEASRYDLNAVFYVEPPVGDGPESDPVAWTVTPKYRDPGIPPADLLALYPSAEQLTAAVASITDKQARLPTPASNGLYLRGNTDGSFTFSSFPTGVSGTWTAASFSGSGAALTNLNPAALSGPVGVALGGTGAATAAAALTSLGGTPLTAFNAAVASFNAGIALLAPINNPTFTGTVNIPAGASIAGFAPLASPTFTGTVTIPAGASIAGFALLASPTFTGTVTATAFAGDGSGLTGMAPFHPATVGTAGFSPATGVSFTAISQHCSDVSGELSLTVATSIAAGTLLGTINFATAYAAPLPPTVLWLPVSAPAGSTGTITATIKSDGTCLQLYAGTTIGTAGTYKYQYFIPVR